MKKIFLVIIAVILTCLLLTGCGNRTLIIASSFSRAIVYAPGGTKVAEGKVMNWGCYSSGQMWVCIDDKTYLTAAENIILIKE